jgi:hypothetical protein
MAKAEIFVNARPAAVAAALVSCVACGSDQAATAPSTFISLENMVISGNASLTRIGETSQLKATVTFCDGTTRDVTSDLAWSSSDPSVLIVSSKGLLTVIRFGVSRIRASVDDYRFREVLVRATPAGTFTVFGRVHEPGQGGESGLGIDRVGVRDTLSGASTTTNARGQYSIGALTSAHLRFEKGGYEPVEIDATPDGEDKVPMQRVVRVIAGQTVTPVPLAPHDLDYTVALGAHCYPCRLIRVVVPAPGTLRLGLTWSDSARQPCSLALWVAGRQFLPLGSSKEVEADVRVSAGEAVVYVGEVPACGYQLPFTLATSLTE